MWTIRYDNEADYQTMIAQAKAEGYRFVFWASDDCAGFKGGYNGGSLVFYDSIESIDDKYVRMDAEAHGEPL